MRGISLIEAILYLVISLSIIIGGTLFFKHAQYSNHIQQTARVSAGIISQTRSVFMEDPLVLGDITEVAVKSGMVPADYLDGAGGISHPFSDGGIRVYSDQSSFYIHFQGIGYEPCMRLSTVADDGTAAIGTGITGMAWTFYYQIPATVIEGLGLQWTAPPVSPLYLGVLCNNPEVELMVQFEK